MVEVPEITGLKASISAVDGAKAALPQFLPMPADPELRLVVDAWSTLPTALRAAVVALVRAGSEAQQ